MKTEDMFLLGGGALVALLLLKGDAKGAAISEQPVGSDLGKIDLSGLGDILDNITKAIASIPKSIDINIPTIPGFGGKDTSVANTDNVTNLWGTKYEINPSLDFSPKFTIGGKSITEHMLGGIANLEQGSQGVVNTGYNLLGAYGITNMAAELSDTGAGLAMLMQGKGTVIEDLALKEGSKVNDDMAYRSPSNDETPIHPVSEVLPIKTVKYWSKKTGGALAPASIIGDPRYWGE